MAVPKIDRESGLFEKNVCDKINKKVQLLQDNINELEVPPLNPFYKVEKISNFIDTPKISSGYIDEESNPYFYYADVSITEDNSFSIGDDTKVNILNFTIKLSNIKFNSDSETNFYTLGKNKIKVGKVKKSPICDVWFSTENGGCLVHIPAGKNDFYIIPNGVNEINVFCWYI